MKVKPFSPGDMTAILGDTELLRAQASLNQCAGPGYTLFDDNGQPVFCGGVRNQGVGEAWFIARPKDLEDPSFGQKKEMVRQVRTHLEGIVRDYGFYRLWANCEISERFLTAVGFEKADNGFTHIFPVRVLNGT